MYQVKLDENRKPNDFQRVYQVKFDENRKPNGFQRVLCKERRTMKKFQLRKKVQKWQQAISIPVIKSGMAKCQSSNMTHKNILMIQPAI